MIIFFFRKRREKQESRRRRDKTDVGSRSKTRKEHACIAFSHDLFTFYALLSCARLVLDDALLPFTWYASAENAFRNGTIAQLTTIKAGRSLALIAFGIIDARLSSTIDTLVLIILINTHIRWCECEQPTARRT